MEKTQIFIVRFQEIKTSDPKIEVNGNLVYIKPYYLNYPFIMNFACISLFIYVLFLQNDSLSNLVCFIGIGALVIMTITVLKYYNTLAIDMEKKVVTIQPSPLSLLLRKKRVIKFGHIKTVTVVSNIKTTGYWWANRRYYITLVLNDSDEIKIVGSNNNETAIKIAENMNSILKQV